MRRSAEICATFLFLVVGAPGAAVAQDFPLMSMNGYALSLGGYQGSMTSPVDTAGSPVGESAWGLLRTRLRGGIKFAEPLRLQAEYELRVSGSSIPTQAPASPRIPRQWVSLDGALLERPSMTVRHGLDRLYLRYDTDQVTCIVGRQLISWGTARVWRPTDLFNPHNPVDYGKPERDGADAITVRWYFGDLTDVQAVYNADRSTQWNNWGIRFRTNVAEIDLGVMGGSIGDRFRLGGDFAANLFTAGLRGEFLYSRDRLSRDDGPRDTWSWVLGLDHQLTGELYMMAEFYHDGAGAPTANQYRYDLLLSGEIINLAMDYFVVSANYLFSPLLQTSVTANVNIRDGSGYFLPSVTYSLLQDMQVSASGLWTYGSAAAEYGRYPSSVFARVQLFF